MVRKKNVRFEEDYDKQQRLFLFVKTMYRPHYKSGCHRLEGNREGWRLILAHGEKSVGLWKSDNIFSNILIDTSPSHNFIKRRAESNHSWKTCRSVTKSRSLRRVYLFLPFLFSFFFPFQFFVSIYLFLVYYFLVIYFSCDD